MIKGFGLQMCALPAFELCLGVVGWGSLFCVNHKHETITLARMHLQHCYLQEQYSMSEATVFVTMTVTLQVELDKERKRDLQKSNYSCMYYGNPGTGKVRNLMVDEDGECPMLNACLASQCPWPPHNFSNVLYSLPTGMLK